VALDGQVFGIQFKDQLQQKLILSWLFQEPNITALDAEVIKGMSLMMDHFPPVRDTVTMV